MEEEKSKDTSPKTSNTGRIIIYVLLVLVIAAGAFAAGMYFGSNVNEVETTEPTTSNTQEPNNAANTANTKSVCFVEGTKYEDGESFVDTEQEQDCVCQNGSVVCSETVEDTTDVEDPVDENTTTDYEEIEVGVKYWAADEQPAKRFKITVPKGTEIKEEGGAQVVTHLIMAPNATLSFTIPHTGFNETFQSVSPVVGAKMPNLHTFTAVGQVSPDIFGYTDSVNTDTACESVGETVPAPCGLPALSEGLKVSCSWMAGGGNNICNRAMMTFEFVE